MSILIFACDHRKNVDWKLPYIRLGCPDSDSKLTSEDDEITPYQTVLSEGALIWWVWKNLSKMNSPNYVGICHYRRFFSLAAKMPIINIDESMFKPEFCLAPLQQEAIIKQCMADGIVFHPLNVVNCLQTGCKTIVDQLKWIVKHDKLGIPDDICDKAFELLLNNTSNDMKEAMRQAMYEQQMYACNIFTLDTNLFDLYCKIVIPASVQLYQLVDKSELKYMHPRFLGYILERMTSCYLHAIQKLGKKLIVLPLMTINGERHVHWEAPSR